MRKNHQSRDFSIKGLGSITLFFFYHPMFSLGKYVTRDMFVDQRLIIQEEEEEEEWVNEEEGEAGGGAIEEKLLNSVERQRNYLKIVMRKKKLDLPPARTFDILQRIQSMLRT